VLDVHRDRVARCAARRGARQTAGAHSCAATLLRLDLARCAACRKQARVGPLE
jgi:hypothetical protein